VLHAPPTVAGEMLEELQLRPRIRWYQRMSELWRPGEEGARTVLEGFLAEALFQYGEARNRPDLASTSRLSPHLHFGEIGPRQVWAAVATASRARGIADDDWRASSFLKELGWREFAHHLLFHFPRTPLEPLRAEFARFPWADDARLLHAWERGRTGFPLVDAGLRELGASGWMHNRVRMIVASFLTKNLLQPWQEGARWFWDTLVDADLASNTLGWQWTAGCGADAAPYFRIFNPLTQGVKFDPDGDYVRRWVPELAAIEGAEVHAVDARRARAPDYPAPLVDLASSRAAALTAYDRLRTP
jgi:deoxyribodipyrimidine photo-lyase